MVHFGALLSGHLALVAQNDPFSSAAAYGADPTASAGDDKSAPQPPMLLEFEQPKGVPGLLVTKELESAIERVKKNVADISRACRARNSKFRDVEFDLEEDREKCLHGLNTSRRDRKDPSDVQRVAQAFREPQFYVDGPSSTDVIQGDLGNCWFLSAIAAVATKPELVEKICVAKDEQVGVYGFTFQRNGVWVDVIIDDLLFTSVPKYEELTPREQLLYHKDKDLFNGTSRHGSKSVYFAKSGDDNETWVPLFEKAYAKLHGDYASLTSGHVGEAMEDITGGVSTIIHVNDILDTEQFWQQLLRANEDYLFGCSIYDLRKGVGVYPNDPGYGLPMETVNGLYTAHAYSIIKAVEFEGKKFLRLRNPWGNSEWTGRWADGSKEWTPEWLAALPKLGHTFGDDGAFVMEYSDFLRTWTLVHRTKLFDPSWVVSSLWVDAKTRLPGSAWDYGDVSFTFTLPSRTPVIIVLSKLDDRYGRGILDRMRSSLDFQVFRKGFPDVVVASGHSVFHSRSVNAEVEGLDAGEYVVHVRVDSEFSWPKDYWAENVSRWNARKLAQVMTNVSVTSAILANFPSREYDMWLPRPASMFGGRDLQQVQAALDEYNRRNEAAVPPHLSALQAFSSPIPGTPGSSGFGPGSGSSDFGSRGRGFQIPAPGPSGSGPSYMSPERVEENFEDEDEDFSDEYEEDDYSTQDGGSEYSAGPNARARDAINQERRDEPEFDVQPNAHVRSKGSGRAPPGQPYASSRTKSRTQSSGKPGPTPLRTTRNDQPSHHDESTSTLHNRRRAKPPAPSRQSSTTSTTSTESLSSTGGTTDTSADTVIHPHGHGSPRHATGNGHNPTHVGGLVPIPGQLESPDLALGLRVFTKDYAHAEIKAQIRSGPMYPWRGV